ncbi:MAG: agmatine deiminase family protein, partial [Planctomycetota bacterium]
MNATPRERGLAFPAEWQPHAATWMSWPRPEGISFPDRYEKVLPDLARIVAEIAKREPVKICIGDRGEAVRAVLAREFEVQGYETALLDRVTLFPIPINEPWCRDHGPAFVVPREEPAARGAAGGPETRDWAQAPPP